MADEVPDTYLPDATLLDLDDAVDAGDPVLGQLYSPLRRESELDPPEWQAGGFNSTTWAASSGTSQNLAIPSTATPGHLGIIVVAINGTASNDVTISGWTRKHQTTLAGWGDTFAMLAVFYKPITSSDPGTNAAITLGAQPRGGASIHCFAGAETNGDPFEDPEVSESAGSAQPVTLNVTTAGPRRAIFTTITYDTTTILANIASFDRRYIAPTTTDAGHVAVLEGIASPAVVPVTWTLSSNNRNTPWAVAIKPTGTNTVGTNAPAEVANTTTVAEQPKLSIAPGAEQATVTAAANQPAPSVKVNAENAAVTATANDATVSVTSSGNAPAGNAAVTVTAEQVTVTVATNAGNAAVTAAANQPTIKVAPGSQVANVNVTAEQPTRTVAPGSQVANVTTTANDPTRLVKPGAENAPVNATANQPSVVLGTFAAAQNAAVTAAANGSAQKVSTAAELAAVTAAANQPAPSVRLNAGLAAVTAAGLAPTGSVAARPPAADVAATVPTSSQRVRLSAGVAAVAAAAGDITSVVPPTFKHLRSKPVRGRTARPHRDLMSKPAPPPLESE